MATKFIGFFFLLSIVTISSQRNRASDDEHQELLHDKGIQKLKKHFLGHTSQQDTRQRPVEDNPNLLNIQTLHLYFKPQIVDPLQRSDPQGRCGSGRCDLDSNEDETRSEFQQLLKEVEKEIGKGNSLRCSQVRCGEGLSEDEKRCGCRPRNDDKDDDDDSEPDLRCRGNICSKRPGRTEHDLKSELERYGEKYKISDDLDAIVLDISKLDGLLGKANDRVQINEYSTKNAVKNRYLDYLDYNRHDRDDSDSVKAVIVDLGQLKDADVLKRLENVLLNDKEDPVRPNDLADFYEYKKQYILSNALNFVTNKRGDKNILSLSNEQKNKLQKLRALVQRLGAHSDSKKIKAQIKDIVLGKAIESEILPHEEGTNNVYVPDWLHRAVKNSRDYLRNKKLLLPLPKKQKLNNIIDETKKHNVWRRNLQQAVQEYGVPFELQIQGLGQVNS